MKSEWRFFECYLIETGFGIFQKDFRFKLVEIIELVIHAVVDINLCNIVEDSESQAVASTLLRDSHIHAHNLCSSANSVVVPFLCQKDCFIVQLTIDSFSLLKNVPPNETLDHSCCSFFGHPVWIYFFQLSWSLLLYRRCAHVNCLFLHGLDRHLSHPIFIRFSLCLHINSKSFRFEIKINLL